NSQIPQILIQTDNCHYSVNYNLNIKLLGITMKQVTFAQLIEQVHALSLDEKQQLQLLLEKYLHETRRDEILAAYQESQTIEDMLEFSSDISLLKRQLKA
ncbi:MAG: hypothetical protein R3E08_04545, partial [Thiotrichaceae bacterium]